MVKNGADETYIGSQALLNFSPFVARPYWLWSCASARCFRTDCMKRGDIMETYAYPYSPTAVSCKVR